MRVLVFCCCSLSVLRQRAFLGYTMCWLMSSFFCSPMWVVFAIDDAGNLAAWVSQEGTVGVELGLCFYSCLTCWSHGLNGTIWEGPTCGVNVPMVGTAGAGHWVLYPAQFLLLSWHWPEGVVSEACIWPCCWDASL
jgi:hypothetical protein